MPDITKLLVKNFDIRKAGRECNIFNCHEKPTKIISFREKRLIKLSEKEIAKIYLCENHSNSLGKLIREMNSISIKNKKIISFDMQELKNEVVAQLG